MSVKTSMTALADQVRRLSNETSQLGIDAMTEVLSKISLGTTYYSGPYTVTPTIDDQSLATQGYTMNDNLTIKAIPTYEVSNQQQGTTFIIGGTD